MRDIIFIENDQLLETAFPKNQELFYNFNYILNQFFDSPTIISYNNSLPARKMINISDKDNELSLIYFI